MDRFYFTRHGLTDANSQKLLCGAAWDISLNAEGHAQAERAAAETREALASIRTICCSPLLRARQTADYFVQQLGIPLAIIEELKEQTLGEWERQPWMDVPEFFSGSKEPPSGETRAALEARVERGLQLALRHEGPVLIVSHGAVWYALHRVLGIPAEPPGSCLVHCFQEHTGSLQRTSL